MSETENLHKGHRQKVRALFLANGLNGMADHNVLEFLLFFGIPQRDTNELAHRLIEHFGSFADVLRAGVTDLKNVSGMTENAACLLHAVLPVYQRYCVSLAEKRPVFQQTKDVELFARPYFLDAISERVFLLCMDDNHRLLAMRKLNEGSLSSVALDLRAIAAAALETKAKSAVLLHNHPNGIAQPSIDDIETTRRVRAFLQQLQVQLIDHLILTEHDVCSMAKLSRCRHLFYDLDETD